VAGNVLTSNGSGGDPTYLPAGSGNRGLFSGPLSPAIPSQSATGFSTWLNQGSATETDTAMGMSFSKTSEGAGHAVRGLIKSAPATPYSAIGLLIMTPYIGNYQGPVFGWYDGTNKLDVLHYQTGGSPWLAAHETYSTPNNQASQTIVSNADSPSILWVRAKDDGTNVSLSISSDGVLWIDIMAPTPKSSAYLGSSGYSNLVVGTDAYSNLCIFTLTSYSD
jgi:hypothetical protein